MSDEEFLKLIDAGVNKLPSEILAKLDNVAIVMADEPTAEQRVENELEAGEVLFGLYVGVPLADRGLEEEFRLPDKITIFKQAILNTYSEPADIAACVENTVWHELAHHFGWDEEWVQAEEVKRGKTL